MSDIIGIGSALLVWVIVLCVPIAAFFWIATQLRGIRRSLDEISSFLVRSGRDRQAGVGTPRTDV